MKRITTTLVNLVLALSFFTVTAQEDNSHYDSDWKFTPSVEFDGMLKSRFEYAYRTNTSRFSVRNSRLGIFGSITPLVGYRAQMELSNEGKLSILDLYASLEPIEGLNIKLGQSCLPIHNAYTVSPGDLLFANRAFIGKFFTPDARDIGLSASYDFKVSGVPIGMDVGVYNGNKSNEPAWTSTPSYSTRLRLGNMDGFRTTAKLLKYPISEMINFMFYGFDLRYQANNWKVEAEVMHRENKLDNDKLIGAYLQSAYWFPLQKSKMFKNMITAARWDGMASNQTGSNIDVNRLTVGLGFSFTQAPFESLIRIDYEFYFTNNDLPQFSAFEEMSSNKLSVELQFTF